jgi:hypothetical protein
MCIHMCQEWINQCDYLYTNIIVYLLNIICHADVCKKSQQIRTHPSFLVPDLILLAQFLFCCFVLLLLLLLSTGPLPLNTTQYILHV